MEIFIYLLIIIGIIIYLLDIIIHLFGSSSSYSKNKKQNNLQDLKPSQSENKSKKESIIKTFVKVDPKEEEVFLRKIRKYSIYSNNPIVNILKSKGITKLYHVTSLKNWKSIQNRGGGYTVYTM